MATNTGTAVGYSYRNITLAAPTTTVVKTGTGILGSIIINTPLANGVVTIYDNTSGTGSIIGTITLPATLLSSGPMTVEYNAEFTTGLTVVTSGAAQNITVTYI